MKTECPPIESFAELASLRPDNPHRLHMESCPRCRARMAAFTAFMEIHPLPEGAWLEDARQRLTASIRRESEVRNRAGRSTSSPFSWFRAGRPVWRPALGLATLLLVAGFFLRAGLHRDVDTAPIMRDTVGPAATGGPLAVERESGGGIRFLWHPVPSAETYTILIYSTDLVEIARISAGADTTVYLPPDRLAILGAPSSPVFWRIAALQHGDEVSLSPPATLRLP
jgi:hypothetical protein